MTSGLIVICGATATGKSSLALALAQRLASVILSADSRQIYRGFDIGTAKPTPQEQQQVPHYLIDLCEPTHTFTVADYQKQAQALISSFVPRPSSLVIGHAALDNELHQANDEGQGTRNKEYQANDEGQRTNDKRQTTKDDRRPPPSTLCPLPPTLLVGGTGLYIKAIVQGMTIPNIAPQPDLRAQLQQMGLSQCYAMLQQVDPTAAAKIHPHDPTRIMRSLEVFYVTGKPISALQTEQPPNYPILQIGLDCQDTDALRQRIQQRTGHMLEMGFVAEVESLCQQYGAELSLLDTLGYREIKQHLAGELSLSEAEALIVQHTRQFAKRQRTWFRANPAIVWLDADAPDLVEQAWQHIQTWIYGNYPGLT